MKFKSCKNLQFQFSFFFFAVCNLKLLTINELTVFYVDKNFFSPKHLYSTIARSFFLRLFKRFLFCFRFNIFSWTISEQDCLFLQRSVHSDWKDNRYSFGICVLNQKTGFQRGFFFFFIKVWWRNTGWLWKLLLRGTRYLNVKKRKK